MINLEDFKNTLLTTIKLHDIDHFLIHTDALRAPFRSSSKTQKDILQDYVTDIDNLTAGINYSLPCFNYDFIKTGIYSVIDSECQVGAINEYVRRSNYSYRTLTPVFSYTYKFGIDFKESLIPCDPFSKTSFFDYLKRKKTILLHYGSEIVHSTLIHYIERIGKSLLYRYDKVFKGVVFTSENEKIGAELIYHVRPKNIHLKYANEKLRIDLLNEGIMIEWAQKGQRVSFCDYERLVEFWLFKFNSDPYYFLDDETVFIIDTQIQKLGRKFLLSDFEYEK